MSHRFSCCSLGRAAALVAVLLGSAAGRAADDKDPQKTFDEVFGETYKKAVATAATEDDIELAKDLCKAVLTIDMPTSLVQVITGKMETLAEKSVGAALPTVEALEKLAAKDPKQKLQVEAKMIALLEKAHATGDSAETRKTAAAKLMSRLVPLADQEMADRKIDSAVVHYKQAVKLAREAASSAEVEAISAKLAVASDQQKQAADIDAMEKRIEANPKDAEARAKLIRIHLVERNDPAAAIWFAGEGVDETTRRLLPIAAKDGANADAKSLADLGSWYMDLAGEGSNTARIAMLNRAKVYFERFVAGYKENDLLKAKATLSLDQIGKKLKELTGGTAAALTPVKPETPTTPSTPATSKPAGALTVSIDGPTVTEPDRVDRLYQQHARIIGKEYVAIGGDYAPALEFDPKFPSSARETLVEVTKRMTTTKIERVGIIRKTITVLPVPAEAEAVAMALPSFDRGAYGYLHSVEVAEIAGEEEMLVKNVWMVDPQTLVGVNFDERQERDKLRRRQDDWNWGRPTMRLCGYPTAGLKVGDRVGIAANNKGKPLQIIIVKTEPQNNTYKPQRPIAAVTAKITRGGLDEKQFDGLLTKRNLTHTDLVNIYLEAQRSSAKNTVEAAIKRIEAKGARVP